jgi:hypothetical protein
MLTSVNRNFKPAYLIKRIDNGELVEGPIRCRVPAQERAERLAELLGLALFVHSKNMYGKWRVWYRTDQKAMIIDLQVSQYEVAKAAALERRPQLLLAER